MKKILMVIGTRPEAIKMCPLYLTLRKNRNFDVKLCVTGQHKEMLDTVLKIFSITPDYNLEIMKNKQTLEDITTAIMEKLPKVLITEKPDMVLVHGDTTTTFASALAAFYANISIGHVEAGLRTGQIKNPFPEEFNRRAVSLIADLHFAPTERAKKSLINEGIANDKIFVTGNTGIDALKYTVREDYSSDLLDWIGSSQYILLTAHRRENIGKPLENIFKAVKRICTEFPELKVIYPVHPNPVIRQIADKIIGDIENIKLISPLDVVDFHNIMSKSKIILSDSGGIQEEAPSLGKPVLVLRKTTERPEGIDAGTLKLVGTDEQNIYKELKTLLFDSDEYNRMSNSLNPFGNGDSSETITKILEDYFYGE